MSDAAQSSDEQYDDWAADGESSREDEPEQTETESESETEGTEDTEAETDDDADDESPEESVARREYDELKGRFADLEHRYKSDEGRVQSMRKQIADLEAQLAETRQKVPEEPVEPESEDWSEFKELYPKAAEQLVKQMESARKPTPEPERPAWDAVMDAARPGWRDAIATEDFGQWLQTQPAEWQQLAQVPDGFAALQVYDRYKGHLDENRRKADTLKAQRKQRLESSESVGGARSKPPPDNDPLSGWAAD